MKKIKIVSFLFSVVLGLSIVLIPAKADAQLFECRVEIIDCPGWGTGDRQVCHQSGSGLRCICGTSTTCPKDNLPPMY